MKAKWIQTLLPVFFGSLIAACAVPTTTTTGTQSAASAAVSAPLPADSAPSINARIGTALSEVTIARQAFTDLASAGKITWAQDDSAQAALTAIRSTLNSAQTLIPTDPAQAATLLAAALQALAVYQAEAK